MKASLSLVVLLAAFASSSARAQGAPDDGQRKLAERWLYMVEWVGMLSAKGYVGSHACQQGDPEVWKRAAAALDRIYQRCVPAQPAVARIVESKYALELLVATNGSKRAVGTLSFERWLGRASDVFNKSNRAEVCATPAMKRWLESGYVDPKDNWEWFDQTFPYKLGTDPSLAEQPCADMAAQDDPK